MVSLCLWFDSYWHFVFVKLSSLCWNFLAPKLAGFLSQALLVHPWCTVPPQPSSPHCSPSLIPPLLPSEAGRTLQPPRLVLLWSPLFLFVSSLQQPLFSHFPFSDSFRFPGPIQTYFWHLPFTNQLSWHLNSVPELPGPPLNPGTTLQTPVLALVCLSSLALHCRRCLALGSTELLSWLVPLTAQWHTH